MREIKGDLFKQKCDAICITTNGYVKSDGRAVMGRGCARQAAKKWPDLPYRLGQAIQLYGNIVFAFDYPERPIITFPVKHIWSEKADLELIERSAQQLMKIIDRLQLNSVILPRPGCGNGNLSWEEVEPVISPILDDRISVITF